MLNPSPPSTAPSLYATFIWICDLLPKLQNMGNTEFPTCEFIFSWSFMSTWLVFTIFWVDIISFHFILYFDSNSIMQQKKVPSHQLNKAITVTINQTHTHITKHWHMHESTRMSVHWFTCMLRGIAELTEVPPTVMCRFYHPSGGHQTLDTLYVYMCVCTSRT